MISIKIVINPSFDMVKSTLKEMIKFSLELMKIFIMVLFA
ncbi:hypothetical protein mru_0848 [Methanobrevibacter ruminantium M1]|uniref:Uncharacterized protein n=1 Tax=Methanobrevibacter ruminantium (strain ATCC 35063 / DSM 1093 / JCM 13430 / OCM 146 / M1) TaxID=634498 RepID=D3E2D8_METRM|nr:hypothetical protein mru_0848 [Methanobrevibacter ruminantium M1]